MEWARCIPQTRTASEWHRMSTMERLLDLDEHRMQFGMCAFRQTTMLIGYLAFPARPLKVRVIL